MADDVDCDCVFFWFDAVVVCMVVICSECVCAYMGVNRTS